MGTRSYVTRGKKEIAFSFESLKRGSLLLSSLPPPPAPLLPSARGIHAACNSEGYPF